MDKQEFNFKMDKIKKLVSAGDYATAEKIADTIEWRKVKNTNLLSIAADVYEKNDRLQDAKDLLILALERAPVGKRLLYKLTELSVRSGDIEEAEDYYNEYREIAGDDSSSLILEYMILKSKHAPYDRLLFPLEEYNRREVDEKWLYELATTYEFAGRIEECIKVCDRIALMFGSGKYAIKALKLKQRYTGLTDTQKALVYPSSIGGIGHLQSPETEGQAAGAEDAGDVYAYEGGEGPEESYVIRKEPSADEISEALASSRYEDEEAAFNRYAIAHGLAVPESEMGIGELADRADAREAARAARAEREALRPAVERAAEPVREAAAGIAAAGTAAAGTAAAGTAMAGTAAVAAGSAAAEIRAEASAAEETFRAAAEETLRPAAEEVYRPAPETAYSPAPEASYRPAAAPEAVIEDPEVMPTGTIVREEPEERDSDYEERAEAEVTAAAAAAGTAAAAVSAAADVQEKPAFEIPKVNLPTAEESYIPGEDDFEEDEEELFSGIDLSSYHMIIEAETIEEGVAIAIDELKAAHKEAGIQSQAVKTTAEKLNVKGLSAGIRDRIRGKDFVIESAGDLDGSVAQQIYELIGDPKNSTIVVLIDTPEGLDKLEAKCPALFDVCDVVSDLEDDYDEPAPAPAPAPKKEEPEIKEDRTAVPVSRGSAAGAVSQKENNVRVNVPESDDEEMEHDDFAQFCYQYATEIDCSITGKSMLALHERIELMEEDGIPLTKANAVDLIEEAADRAEKPPIGRRLSGMFKSKYDKDGLLILKEEDFFP